MFKLYRAMAARVILYLLWAKHVKKLGDPGAGEIYYALREMDQYELDKILGEDGRLKLKSMMGMDVESSELDLVIRNLLNQHYYLAKGIQAKHDSDLIDTVVKLLNFPYGGNVISGATLSKLRSSIMVPEELAGLIARVRKEERACGGCGRDLASGELVTYWNDGNSASVRCAACLMPTLVAGSDKGCQHVGPLAKLAQKWLKKSMQGCEICHKKEEGVPQEAREVVDEQGPSEPLSIPLPEPTVVRDRPAPPPAGAGVGRISWDVETTQATRQNPFQQLSVPPAWRQAPVDTPTQIGNRLRTAAQRAQEVQRINEESPREFMEFMNRLTQNPGEN